MNEDLRYSKEHLWAKIDHRIATVGLTDFAQKEMGEVIYIGLKSTYENVQKGESIGTIESAKTIQDLVSPLTGKIVGKNPRLGKDPSVINRDPYGEGWLIKIEIVDSSELDTLVSEVEYKELVER